MSILSTLLGGNKKAGIPSLTDILRALPDNLPEPPKEAKEAIVAYREGRISIEEMVKTVSKVAEEYVKQMPCPVCGKFHGTEEIAPEVPKFGISDGKSGDFEFQPHQVSAIQLLDDNYGEVAKFLIVNRVPFLFDGSEEKGLHFHLFSVVPSDDSTEDLNIGDWAVVRGSRSDIAGTNFSYTVYEDGMFRESFRTRADNVTVADTNTPESILEAEADRWSKDAEKDALDAYDEDDGS